MHLYGHRIYLVLFLQYARGQGVCVIGGQDWNFCLYDNRSAIKFMANVMYAGAVFGVIVIDRQLMCVEPLVLWQQRRVNIDQTMLVVVYEIIAQYPHETGEYDQVRIQWIDDLRHRLVERFPVRKQSVVDDVVLDVCLC